MKWLGSGMQARFLLAMGGAMVVVVAILAVLLGRQTAMQSEVRTLSGGVIHELFDRSVRSRGEAMARELSDALANPLYYRDLDQVGVLVRSTARQPVVRYVLVFDERGRPIGSHGAGPYWLGLDGSRVVGAVYADRCSAGEPITQVDLELLQAFAESATLWLLARRALTRLDAAPRWSTIVASAAASAVPAGAAP